MERDIDGVGGGCHVRDADGDGDQRCHVVDEDTDPVGCCDLVAVGGTGCVPDADHVGGHVREGVGTRLAVIPCVMVPGWVIDGRDSVADLDHVGMRRLVEDIVWVAFGATCIVCVADGVGQCFRCDLVGVRVWAAAAWILRVRDGEGCAAAQTL